MAFIDLETEAENQGTNYLTRDFIQDIDSNFSQLNISINNYSFQFTDANLVSGVLSVNHSLNTQYPLATLIRPDGTFESVEPIMTRVDANNVTFDFGGSIQSGTWNGLIKTGA